jgi:tetratricopeptide (TPR) repeat protein
MMRALAVALALASSLAGAQEIDCALVDHAELDRALLVELGARMAAVSLRCDGERAELHVGDRAPRTVELAATPASARARLLALAAAEIDRPEPPAAPARTTRRNRSEGVMWKRILAHGVIAGVAASAAASSPPKAESPVKVEPLAFSQPRAKEKRVATPGLRAEDVRTLLGAKVHEVTDAQIRLLERLLAATRPGDPERADLRFRLGDLHGEERRYFQFRARTLDDARFAAERRGDRAAATRIAGEQAADERGAERALVDAVKQLLAIANDDGARGYARLDEVLFDLAQLLAQSGKPEAARGFYRRLVKDHPGSRFVPDALIAFADWSFDDKRLDDALQLYEKVMAHADSPLALYAQYKSGWCWYNLGDFARALDTFVAVLGRSRRSSGKIALEREARKDAVRAFAQIGAPERAWPLFRRVGGEAAPAMLESLAELYGAEGRFADAIKIWRQLIALEPEAPSLCARQGEVVKATLGLTGSRAESSTVRELERLRAAWEWSQRRAIAPASLAECRELTRGLLRELATVWHQEAQRTQQPSTYERAIELYREYLKSFSRESDSAAMKYYLSEAYYRLDRHCEAAPLYVEVAKSDAAHRDEAAWAALLSWRSCLKLAESPTVEEQGATEGRRTHPAPKSIPDSWKRFLDAIDLYLAQVKSSPERVKVKYRKARILYEYDHLDEAIPIFRDIAFHDQDSELAVFAADLLFDCYAQKEDKAQLSAASGELCAAPALTGRRADFARRCRSIRTALARDQAEQLEAAGELRAAADRYLELANSDPDDARLDEILFDAGVDYQRAKMIGLAVMSFQQLIAARPESPLAKRAYYSVARSYQDIAAFDAAAENYERFAIRWPGEKEAAQALMQASFFRRGIGESDKAVEDSRLYQRNYAARPEAAAAAFVEAQVYEGARDWKRLAEHWQRYLASYGARGGIDRQLIAHVKLGELDWRRACAIDGTAGACVELQRPTRRADACGQHARIVVHAREPRLAHEAQAHFAAALAIWDGGKARDRVPLERRDEMAYFAAEARMLEGDAEYEKFLARELPAGLQFGRARARDAESRKRLAAWLVDKQKQLEIARKHYESVILMRQAHWAIAAAARVGQLFQSFGAQLDGAPVPHAPPAPAGVDPRAFSDDFHNAFCDALGEHVTLLEDKAEEALHACLSRSTELSWFNEWSSLCESELNRLKPHSYPLAAELRAEPGFVAVGVDRAGLQSLPR